MADDLHHLRRGGRVSGAAAFVGTMLSVKPMININDEGRLIPAAKVRGKSKSLEFMAERFAESRRKGCEPIVCISHSDTPEEALELRDMITKRCGPCEFIITEIGPVIGAHTGPGTVTLFFEGEKR
jgi:DegV family protein with EDD domain